MQKELLTIITPVYNRSALIGNLYQSLVKQVNGNFVWMIVDDGSTDNISQVVEPLILTSNFKIYFFRKENGGKHTALNYAFSKLDTELALIVDSDDTLTEDATDIVEKVWMSRPDSDIAGCIFLKGYADGECVGDSELDNGVYDMIKVMFSHNIKGDKAEVFRSDVLCKYRFPEFQNERYMGEDYIWKQIYLKHKMLYVNNIIYICEYLEDGLTKQGRKLRLVCPYGGMENSKVSFGTQFPLRERIKRAWLFVCYGKFAGLSYREIIERSGYPCLIRNNYLMGVMLYYYWKKKYM